MFEFPREERIQIFAKLEIELEKSIKARKFPPPQEIVDNRQQSRPKTDLFFFFLLFGLVFPLPCNSSGCTLGLTFDDATIFIRAAILFSSRDTRSTKKDPDKRRERKERAEKVAHVYNA